MAEDKEKAGALRRRTVLDLALLVAVLFWAGWQWHLHGDQYLSAARLVRSRVFPCTTTITYSIGAVDPRYDITRDEFMADLREAKAVWEAALRRPLFELQVASGDITVNMVYDQRQAAVDRLKEIGVKTGRGLSSYHDLKDRYDALAAQVDPRRAQLEARVAAYRRGADAYNAVVAKFNRRGRATPQQQRKLNEGRELLQREFAGIKSFERDVNADIDTLNAMATVLNQLIVELNLDVAQYNREGSALGMFEEGHYSLSNGVRTIDIYKYSDRQQLVRLLAHEMGHALGLEHVQDPEGLMAPVNKGGPPLLRPQDAAELAEACASPLQRWREAKKEAARAAARTAK